MECITPHLIFKTMKTLKLFNAVIAKDSGKTKPFISKEGFIIHPNALYAKDEICTFFLNEKLNSEDLNKSFHKSWKKIEESTDFELRYHQIMHYLSTYGTDFTGEVYIPNEVLNLEGLSLKYVVINAYSKEDLINKSLDLLYSGIALKEETVDDILDVLTTDLDYVFDGNEPIKNKEAIIKIADKFDIFPKHPTEFLRYIIYKTTGKTLLIKNFELINLIKSSEFNPQKQFDQFGLDELASVFNRFKPLFLAFNNKCHSTINKLSKLSKNNHKPLIQNPLNAVTNRQLISDDLHWLDNATIFSIFKALNSLHTRLNGQNSFCYKIRNGKSFIKEQTTTTLNSILQSNYNFLITYLKDNFYMGGKKVYLPNDVKYSLPTSEKMFVGNIPVGTKFLGDKLAIGIYWENEWGASDLDLSGINLLGKVGWNESYNQNDSLLYSGDMTDASYGAVEYLYAKTNKIEPTLIQNNVYYGSSTCKYKIIIGKGDDVTMEYMMNPSNLFVEAKCNSVQKQTILGLLIDNSFVILNLGAGNLRVSGKDSEHASKALLQEYSNPLTFNYILEQLGAELTTENDCEFNFSLNSLKKDSFTCVFKKELVYL